MTGRHSFDELSTADSVLWVPTDQGLRFFVDSEVITQAIYVYRPVFDDGGIVVDLEVVRVNKAALRVPLAAHIVEGVRASSVFVDASAAYRAANDVWHGRPVATYHIERRGMDADVPIVVHYEVATLRVGDFIVQVSTDHTTVTQLESADARFRLMADASDAALVLLVRDTTTGTYVIGYANPIARQQAPGIRYGASLPSDSQVFTPELLEQVGRGEAVRTVVRHQVATRQSEFQVVVSPVGADELMLSWRELTNEQTARDELRRSDEVLEAVGRGSFGTIAVYESEMNDGEIAGLTMLWSASDHDRSHEALDPDRALPADDVLRLARKMVANGSSKQTGWVTVPGTGGERSLEFSLVRTGDRFVLEFVERTDELAARAQIAALNASAEAQRAFMSRVSHEMRTPLNVIHGFSQLLSRVQLTPEVQSYAAHIGDGVDRMVQIVDHLLLLGQIEQGVVGFDYAMYTIAELHAAITDQLRHQPWWPSTQVVANHTSRFSAVVRADTTRWGLAIAMLAEATLEAYPTDMLRLDTFVTSTSAGVQLIAATNAHTVRDLWMPFATSHTIPGAGLGLAVARSLLLALGVRVEVRHSLTSPAESSLVLTVEPVS